MFIQIIGVGKLKEKYLVSGIAEYAKRLTPYLKFQMIEVADEKAPDNLSDAEVVQVKVREGERILAHIKSEAHVIALAIDGKLWSSEELAAEIDRLGTYGTSHVVFVIGGSHGLSDEVMRRAQQRMSFGRMTLPHQLMRLVLVEQVYRAVKINRGNRIISRGKFLKKNLQEPLSTSSLQGAGYVTLWQERCVFTVKTSRTPISMKPL